MKCLIIRKSLLNIILAFVFLAACFGCADNAKSTKKDPFFEKWSTLAETSKGHSPKAESKKIDIAALAAQQAAASTGSLVKELPAKKINLTMRSADLKAVLRAMAKAVDLNLLMKNDIKSEVSVDFRGVPWNQAFTGLLRTYGLSYIWEGNVIRVMTIEDIDRDLKQKISMRDIKWVEPLLQPVVINIDYADTKKLAETLQDFLTKDKDGKARGSVKVDEHSNSLVISAMYDDLAKMLPIIEKLDKPTPQILIRANIVETTKGVARDLGIMWSGRYRGNVGGTDHSVTLASAAGSLGLSVGAITIVENLLDVQLQALQKDNKVNILSSPSITTLDNQKAFTENGYRVPFLIMTPSTTVGVAPTQTVSFEDAVLRLEITPHVIDGKNLKMKILVKKDELDFSNSPIDKDGKPTGNPSIIKRQTDTTLIVKDGETIVISGLTKQTKSEGTAGYPGLKDIPVLGWIFKTEKKDDEMEEFLIFITPHILQVADDRQNEAAVEEGKGLKGVEKNEQKKETRLETKQ